LKEPKKIFELALAIGETMLRNGAETFRVEDTIIRILRTSGCAVCESFVTPTGIFVTLDDPSMDTLTYVKRVQTRRVHLDKVAIANQLSRSYCTGEIDIEEAKIQLSSIRMESSYSGKVFVLASSFASACFTIVFGGGYLDAVGALIVGFIVGITHLLLSKLTVSKFFIDLICGMLIAVIGIFVYQVLGIGVHFELIIAGAIMPFVPGVAITNAIFDTIQGNLLSGISRTAEAFNIAASIAIGIGVILKLYSVMIGGVIL
jgi:uncharacterized membrane protein YjjP (DUF1212 family)